MALTPDFMRRWEALKPGDLDAHKKLASDVIAAGFWNPDVAESMINNMATDSTEAKVDEFLDHVEAERQAAR